MLSRVRELFFQAEAERVASLTAEPRLLTGKVRSDPDGTPIQLNLGGRSLRLLPECRLQGDRRTVRDWILVDGERYLHEPSGFVRIAQGQRVRLGRGDDTSQRLFRFPKSVAWRQLEIANDGGRVTLARLDAGGKTYIHSVEDAEEIARPVTSRLASLKAVRRIFGGPLELLPAGQALATLKTVNDILSDEVYRARDGLGRPGGLLTLPDEQVPILVGDLHANLDNLLKVLSENACLESLQRGEASLIILGDAVHPHGDRDLAHMDTSLLMLDVISKLKIMFPRNVFYVRGNHDSFDETVGKGGVPQGILLKNRAAELRGQDYVDELVRFFDSLPYVVRAKDFVACHGGPPRGEVTVADLVNVRGRERLATELIWNRVRRPHHPGGYTKRHVKAFKARLGADEHTPMIVGHTPLSSDETLWLNAGKIPDHHILFSANAHNLSVFVRTGQHFVPLEYKAEPLLDLTNALQVSERQPALETV